MRQNWPERLWLVRHGQSQGNVARDAAHEAGLLEIDIDIARRRRAAVRARHPPGRSRRPLVRRAARRRAAGSHPVVALCPRAPDRRGDLQGRARSPAAPARTIIDERLREREFGVFDRLTTDRHPQKYPEEAAHRAMLGKFYHRAPGGESWADVILRLRSMLNTINLHYCDRRVLVVCHQVVVLCMRYILEELDEAQILAIDKQAEVLNCGICAYEFEPDADGLCVPKLALWNHDTPLEAEGAAKTSAPDAMAGSR